MAVHEFPALGFDPAPGEPGVVAAVEQAVGRQAQRLADSERRLGRLQAGLWTGQAAGAFAADLECLPGDLRRATTAHAEVTAALQGYASELTAAKRQAGQLEHEAAQARQARQVAAGQADSLLQAVAGESDLAASWRAGELRAAQSRVRASDGALAEVIGRAHALEAHLDGIADHTARRILAAAEAPYHKPGALPRLWNGAKDFAGDTWDRTKQFARDHADALRKLSAGLKIVSAAAGLLSFVPVVGGAFAVVAVASGALALGTDALLKASNGEGSWASLGLDATLTLIPGGRLVRPLATAGRAAPAMRAGLQGARRARAGTLTRTAAGGVRGGGRSTLRMPKVPWRYGHLPPNQAGSTDLFGNITIRHGVMGSQLVETVRHERVHRLLSPRHGPLRPLRAKLVGLRYQHSHLARYLEEAAAETYGTASLREGLAFPFRHGYVQPWRVAAEGAGGVGAGSVSYGVYEWVAE
jgi:hypothetical protein